jgi:predicted lysophospholipase L1 biosynthesis ABC-type transport system permease subunit
MDNTKKHLESLTEIKNLMERSSKFISLSGLSGIIAGITALIGAALAYHRMNYYFNSSSLEYLTSRHSAGASLSNLIIELVGIAVIVLVISLVAGILLTIRESKKNNQSIWDKNSMLLLGSLLIPLCTGGIFCLILIYHGLFVFVAPVTLIFYGLALVNCAKYTLNEVKYLGILEIILGLASAIFVGKGIFFWAVGFGILHIVYGTFMHFKYNRNSTTFEE